MAIVPIFIPGPARRWLGGILHELASGMLSLRNSLASLEGGIKHQRRNWVIVTPVNGKVTLLPVEIGDIHRNRFHELQQQCSKLRTRLSVKRLLRRLLSGLGHNDLQSVATEKGVSNSAAQTRCLCSYRRIACSSRG